MLDVNLVYLVQKLRVMNKQRALILYPISRHADNMQW